MAFMLQRKCKQYAVIRSILQTLIPFQKRESQQFLFSYTKKNLIHQISVSQQVYVFAQLEASQRANLFLQMHVFLYVRELLPENVIRIYSQGVYIYTILDVADFPYKPQLVFKYVTLRVTYGKIMSQRFDAFLVISKKQEVHFDRLSEKYICSATHYISNHII